MRLALEGLSKMETDHGPDLFTADALKPDGSLMNLRTFVLLICATGAALLLYYKPAAGLSLLGGLTVLGTLTYLVDGAR